MKKLIVVIAIGFVFAMGRYALATFQPNSIGTVLLSVSSGTVTEIVNSTASAVGELRYCTNCASAGGAGTICVSTGTTLFNQFVLSTGTVCK